MMVRRKLQHERDRQTRK